jgi:hypothetical protein
VCYARVVTVAVLSRNDAFQVYVQTHDRVTYGGSLYEPDGGEQMLSDACQYAMALAAYDSKVGRMRTEAEFYARLRGSQANVARIRRSG